jgi:hypothetical protein
MLGAGPTSVGERRRCLAVPAAVTRLGSRQAMPLATYCPKRQFATDPGRRVQCGTSRTHRSGLSTPGRSRAGSNRPITLASYSSATWRMAAGTSRARICFSSCARGVVEVPLKRPEARHPCHQLLDHGIGVVDRAHHTRQAPLVVPGHRRPREPAHGIGVDQRIHPAAADVFAHLGVQKLNDR